jgi:hypothetical protein
MGRVCKVYEYVTVDVDDVFSNLGRLRGIEGDEERTAKMIEWFGIDPDGNPDAYNMIFDYSEMVGTFQYRNEVKDMTNEGHAYLQDLFDLFEKEVYL